MKTGQPLLIKTILFYLKVKDHFLLLTILTFHPAHHCMMWQHCWSNNPTQHHCECIGYACYCYQHHIISHSERRKVTMKIPICMNACMSLCNNSYNVNDRSKLWSHMVTASLTHKLKSVIKKLPNSVIYITR